jgi:hypothetical protein
MGKERGKIKAEDNKCRTHTLPDLETHHCSAMLVASAFDNLFHCSYGHGGRVVGEPRGVLPRILSLHVDGNTSATERRGVVAQGERAT